MREFLRVCFCGPCGAGEQKSNIINNIHQQQEKELIVCVLDIFWLEDNGGLAPQYEDVWKY